MPKILFLHGLNSRPYEDRIEILMASGAEVFCPHIIYQNHDSVKVAEEIIVKEGITHLVGHSMGGILAYLLSNKYKLPCLMFNPAMHDVNFTYFSDLGLAGDPVFYKQYAVVGMKDDVVYPEIQFKALPLATIYQDPDLGHKVDPETYKRHFDLFYSRTTIEVTKSEMTSYLEYLHTKFGIVIYIHGFTQRPMPKIIKQPKGFHYCSLVYSDKRDPKDIPYGFMVSTKSIYCDNNDAIKYAEELTELAIVCLKLNELYNKKQINNEGI